MGMMTNKAIFKLAERCRPYLNRVIEERGTITDDDVRAALKSIGRETVRSERTCRMIEAYIVEG